MVVTVLRCGVEVYLSTSTVSRYMVVVHLSTVAVLRCGVILHLSTVKVLRYGVIVQISRYRDNDAGRFMTGITAEGCRCRVMVKIVVHD